MRRPVLGNHAVLDRAGCGDVNPTAAFRGHRGQGSIAANDALPDGAAKDEMNAAPVCR